MPIDKESLFPRLKADRTHAIYRHDLGGHMFKHSAAAPDSHDEPVTVAMLEDLQVQFVHDADQGFTLVQKAETEGAEIWDDMALIQQSFRNMKDKLGEELELSILENGLTRVLAGSKYEASFLLLGNLWVTLEEDYGANMYAAVPSHNLLLVGKQGDHRAILELQNAIRGVFFEADRDQLLSKAIYQRLEGEWKIVATAF